MAHTLVSTLRLFDVAGQSQESLKQRFPDSYGELKTHIDTLIDEKLLTPTRLECGKAGFRLLDAADVFNAARLANWQPGLVHIEASARMAGVMREALEFSMRIGIGQFQQIEELMRSSRMRHDVKFPFDMLEMITALSDRLKSSLIGFEPNASFGIHSVHVHESFRQTWRMSKDLRHRMAWDRNPDGGFGVWFDEPDGEAQGTLVWSTSDATRYMVEMTPDQAKLLHRACVVHAMAQECDYSFILDWAKTGLIVDRDGRAPDEREIASAAGVLEALQAQAAMVCGEFLESGLSRDARAIADAIADYLVSVSTPQVHQDTAADWSADRGAVHAADPPAFSIQAACGDYVPIENRPLPEGFYLSANRHRSRVLRLSDESLVVCGQSRSVQTAILLANRAIPREREVSRPAW